MGRRRKRKGYFRRVKPDMGWWVSNETLQATKPASGVGLDMSTVFDFDDINNDNVLITQDKSDWFIKRVIIDAFPVLERDAQNNGPARLFEFGIGTMEGARAGALITTPQAVLSPFFYEEWRRLFKSYAKPVYATWEPIVDPANLLLGTDEAPLSGAPIINTADSPWGLSAIHEDFTVSNAGLVSDSALYLAVSTSPLSPTSRYGWNTGDSVHVAANVRVLLQKRRV